MRGGEHRKSAPCRKPTVTTVRAGHAKSREWRSAEARCPIILQKAAPIFTAVGNVVHSFASGSFRLPVLEQAWCDAAYWLHQALAESIDTIAIAKLETALEVLLRAESSRGSEQRMLEILSAFFDLGPDDPIAPRSLLSARQFARNIVRDRSRILHGTWSTLNARGMDRAGMEGFVVSVLRTAVIELEAYAHSAGPADDIDEFLSWMRRRKMTVRTLEGVIAPSRERIAFPAADTRTKRASSRLWVRKRLFRMRAGHPRGRLPIQQRPL